MGYQDNLYCRKNIIGYTGDILHKPTVYFANEMCGAVTEFGHITQQYDQPENIGREERDWSSGYAIDNLFVLGALRSVESKWGNPFHVSRSHFVPVRKVPPNKMLYLEAAIVAFPDLKTRYR